MVECSRGKQSQVQPWYSVGESCRVKLSHRRVEESEIESSTAMVECSRVI